MFPTPAPEYKKSFENDAQSSDNINFLKVQWSSRQLPTVSQLPWGLGLWGRAQRDWCGRARAVQLAKCMHVGAGGAGHE